MSEEKEWKPLTRIDIEDPDILAKVKTYSGFYDHGGSQQVFTNFFKREVLWEPNSDHWYCFNGKKWEPNEARVEQAIRICLEAQKGSAKKAADYARSLFAGSIGASEKEVLKLGQENLKKCCDVKGSTLDSIKKLARAWMRKPITEFNKDPNLFFCRNGVVNLRTGEFRKTLPEDLNTHIANVDYDPEAKCPRWELFQREITNDNLDLIRFKQDVWGYTLTGLTKWQVFFLLRGEGNNGKSVEARTIFDLMGDYSVSVPFNTFTVSKYAQSTPNDLVGLVGKRMVYCSEFPVGVKLNTDRIKAISGEDVVPARYLFHETFNFIPNCKIFLISNPKPEFPEYGHAIKRRFIELHYEVIFSKENLDEDLKEKLQEEASGILNWCIQGSIRAAYAKPIIPTNVQTKSKEYIESFDLVGTFIKECCESDPIYEESLKNLLSAFKLYHEDVKISSQLLHRNFSDRKFGTASRGGSIYIIGIRLRGSQEEEKGGKSE